MLRSGGARGARAAPAGERTRRRRAGRRGADRGRRSPPGWSTPRPAWSRRSCPPRSSTPGGTGRPGTWWTVVAQAWLSMTRQPGLVGGRGDRDRVVNALGPDAERGTAPALRRDVLDLLAELAPGSAPTRREQVLDRLAWQQPRRAAGRRPLAEAVLAEADLLGVTAAGGLTGYSRDAARRLGARRASSTAGAARRAAARAARAGRPLPGPARPHRRRAGAAGAVPGAPSSHSSPTWSPPAARSVYRVTERSVRRALDAGAQPARTSRRSFAGRSRTPVPQGLSYLIEDAARRHGVLRAGTAGPTCAATTRACWPA